MAKAAWGYCDMLSRTLTLYHQTYLKSTTNACELRECCHGDFGFLLKTARKFYKEPLFKLEISLRAPRRKYRDF